MRLTRSFSTDNPEHSCRERIARYLAQEKYKQISPAPVMTYERGSRLASRFSASPRRWKVHATIRLDPGSGETTLVTVDFDVDTGSQFVIGKARSFWENQVYGLVRAAGSDVIQTPILERLEGADQLENQVLKGASWFFWIAGLSLVNSVISFAGGTLTFLVGLGITQILDALAAVIAEDTNPEIGTATRNLAFLVNLCIAGVVALFGYAARRGKRWSFVVGLILYSLDGLLALALGAYMSAGFHLLALVGIFSGLVACRKLRKAAAVQPAGAEPIG